MNKQYSLFLLLPFALGAVICSAQIPNSGFENWTTHGDHMEPDGWWTANDSINGGGWFPVERSTDHHPLDVGNYSILIKNNPLLLPSWGAFGITWTGDFSGNNYPAFAITGHPTSLWGWYKWSPQNGDSMDVHIRLYHLGTDVGGGTFKAADATTGWTPFSMDFSTYVDADSARIMISACYDNDAPVPHGNSALLIDNLNFDALITGVADIDAAPAIGIFPDPSRHTLTVDLGERIAGHTQLRIVDALGREVLVQDLSSRAARSTVSIARLSAGMHVVQVVMDGRLMHSRSMVLGEE